MQSRLSLALFLLFAGLLPQYAKATECGGPKSLPCGDKEWCNYSPDNLCGTQGMPGQCQKRPEVCTFDFTPVCGCDGITYANACQAHARGSSVAYPGTCRDFDTGTCVQIVVCGTKDGQVKEYPNPCAARKDGATNIVPKEGPTCPAAR
jgi:hypothetical protein